MFVHWSGPWVFIKFICFGFTEEEEEEEEESDDDGSEDDEDISDEEDGSDGSEGSGEITDDESVDLIQQNKRLEALLEGAGKLPRIKMNKKKI